MKQTKQKEKGKIDMTLISLHYFLMNFIQRIFFQVTLVDCFSSQIKSTFCTLVRVFFFQFSFKQFRNR